MKVLWFSNCDLTTGSTTTGSWLYAMSLALIGCGVQICNVTEGSVDTLEKKEVNGIIQYVVPYSKLKNGMPSGNIIKMLQNIECSENPDLIHIWGMENYWGVLSARGYFRSLQILEIQGIKHSCQRVYTANLTFNETARCFRLKEMIAYNRSIPYNKKQFQRWAKFEYEMLSNHKYISTQSEWVRAHIAPYIGKDTKVLNTKMAVRAQFMNKDSLWQGAGSHVIIMIASGPIPYKGAHDVVRALSIVRDSYPNTILKVIGNMGHDAPVWRKSGYTKFLQELISEKNLSDNVIFTGAMNAQDIVAEMKNAGVMTVPSYVETYCLTMAEAMAVGLPCVAAYAGALPELGENGQSALYYSPGDYEVMAAKICQIFGNRELSLKLSKNARRIAMERNDTDEVCAHQLRLYYQVCNDTIG